MDKDSGDDFRQRAQKRPRRAQEYAPREPRPIDAAQLQELAVGYAARYATTGAKLNRYLHRKLSERVWTPAEAPDIESLINRIVTLGYVDDRAYALAKKRDLTARGYGVGRVRQVLAAAGVSREDARNAILPQDGAPDDIPDNAYAPAIAFARRRRFGPFARDADPAQRHDRLRRELAAMARAGHAFDVSRRVLTAVDEAALAMLAQD